MFSSLCIPRVLYSPILQGPCACVGEAWPCVRSFGLIYSGGETLPSGDLVNTKIVLPNCKTEQNHKIGQSRVLLIINTFRNKEYF